MLVYEEVIWNEEYYFNNELFFSRVSYSHTDRLYKKCNEFLKRYGKKQVNTVKSLNSAATCPIKIVSYLEVCAYRRFGQNVQFLNCLPFSFIY